MNIELEMRNIKIELSPDEFLELMDSLESAVTVSDIGFKMREEIENFASEMNYFID